MRRFLFLMLAPLVLAVGPDIGGTGVIVLKDEGVSQGSVAIINCSGAGVTCTRTGTTATISVAGGGGSGTVTSVSVTPQNGVSAVVTDPTVAAALAFTLGAITPTSVAATGTVTGSNLSGTNTGDQTKTCTAQFIRTLATGTGSTCGSVAIADHSATGTASSSTYLRGDNTWATPSTGSGNYVDVTKALNRAGVYSVVVTGQTWVTANSRVVCMAFGATDAGLTAEAVAAAALDLSWSTPVVGDGFTLWIDNPRGLVGTVRFHCTGS